MAFHPIDLDSFPRREHYLSFIGNNQCSYSMTVNVDITALGAHKLYPAMIWLLTRTVNEIPEFRMALVDGVAELADALDLKSNGKKFPYRFKSGRRHLDLLIQINLICMR